MLFQFKNTSRFTRGMRKHFSSDKLECKSDIFRVVSFANMSVRNIQGLKEMIGDYCRATCCLVQ